MNSLQLDRFVHWHRDAQGTVIVKDIFWAHVGSIERLKTFNIVLLIDSTYKTRWYRFPLVEIIDVSSTENTFSVVFAYVEEEKLDTLCEFWKS